MAKYQRFDSTAAIKAAWDLLWADKVKHRGEDYRASHGHYITRSDLVNQVRQFAIEQAEGKPWGSTGVAYGRPWGGSRVRLNFRVDGDVCDWLRREEYEGRITSHNFGRNHISGMRYRPAGEEITETEKQTMANNERRRNTPRPRHFRKSWSGPLLCTPRKNKFSWRPSKSYGTSDPSEVTCPRCKKLLESIPLEARNDDTCSQHV